MIGDNFDFLLEKKYFSWSQLVKSSRQTQQKNLENNYTQEFLAQEITDNIVHDIVNNDFDDTGLNDDKSKEGMGDDIGDIMYNDFDATDLNEDESK